VVSVAEQNAGGPGLDCGSSSERICKYLSHITSSIVNLFVFLFVLVLITLLTAL